MPTFANLTGYTDSMPAVRCALRLLGVADGVLRMMGLYLEAAIVADILLV